ncbi:FAD:protein FMN transferase [Methylogaea oryzae]|uniref:FAD:protein FMN transferase n=1 Tax=Methylogaea oryzae TaxID=1295382 RepID=A0A8D4VKI5_9GAMM|nr:FAD:protein FMN transferase [Methylogaea oryzae]BBL69440.1 FAD:protein FMN transferase [Methylogaea oryzae]
MKKRLVAVLLSGLFILSACQSGDGETELAGSAQGTTYHIKLAGDMPAAQRDGLSARIEATFDDIDRKLSNYRDDSEISRFNRLNSSDWVPVSPEIARLVDIAKQVYERSEGCYDLTVKPLFDLWGFSKHESRVPSQEEIDGALAHVGMSRVEVDLAGARIRRLDPAMQIDLSSIAQGYTVGAIADLLDSAGIHDYLVEVGGEMKVKGRKANGQPWRVAIETPNPFTREVERILEMREQQGMAIMTAGTYRNYFEADGQTYSHILNPKTGRPVTHHLASVTVLHDDPTWADAWDTALLCVGEKEAAKIAETERLKVLLIYRDEGKFVQHASQAFISSQEPQP